MILERFAIEYESLSRERRALGFERIVEWFREHPEEQEYFIEAMIDLSAEDFFGTEGLDV